MQIAYCLEIQKLIQIQTSRFMNSSKQYCRIVVIWIEHVFASGGTMGN